MDPQQLSSSANTNGDQLHRAGDMEAAASLIAGCYSSCLISCAQGQETQTRAHVSCPKSIPQISHRRARRATRAFSSRNLQRLRPDWTPSSLRQNPAVSAAILVFPKIWVAREMRSRRQAGRAEQGGLNNILGFQLCELIIAAFSRPPGAWYNILHNVLYGWSKSI